MADDKNRSSLTDCPAHVLLLVLDMLDVKSLCILSCCCKMLAAVARREHLLWRSLLSTELGSESDAVLPEWY